MEREGRRFCAFQGCNGVFDPATAETDPGDGGGILTGWSFPLPDSEELPAHEHVPGERAVHWHITVNWVDDNTEGGLEADLAKFRKVHAGVTFFPDPDWTPGPGSDQWPSVRISSYSLPAIQSAIRAFAVGASLSEEGFSYLEESWKMNPNTGWIDQVEFTWEVDGVRIGTDVINAVDEHGN